MRFFKKIFGSEEEQVEQTVPAQEQTTQNFEDFLANHPVLYHVPRFNRHYITGTEERLTPEEREAILNYLQDPVVIIYRFEGEIKSFFFIDIISIEREQIGAYFQSGRRNSFIKWDYLMKSGLEFSRFTDLPEEEKAGVDLRQAFAHRWGDPEVTGEEI